MSLSAASAFGTVSFGLTKAHDAVVGTRPLGRFEQLDEDEIGGRFSLRVTPTSYATDIVAMARDGLLGSSVGFAVRDSRGERWRMPKRPSQSNPRAVPEREIIAGDLFEISLTGHPALGLKAQMVAWPVHTRS